MKIAIACDHAGYEYKEKLVEYLRKEGHEVKDFGTDSPEAWIIRIRFILWPLLLNRENMNAELLYAEAVMVFA